jgi:hypothetical protein
MRSIVNGLQPEFKDRILIQYVDADSANGQALLKQYDLPGHPSTVVTGTAGEVLWKQVGGMSERQIYEKLEEFAISPA